MYIQIPPNGYVDHILRSTAVAAASLSTIKGTWGTTHLVAVKNLKYPKRHTNLQQPQSSYFLFTKLLCLLMLDIHIQDFGLLRSATSNNLWFEVSRLTLIRHKTALLFNTSKQLFQSQ